MGDASVGFRRDDLPRDCASCPGAVPREAEMTRHALVGLIVAVAAGGAPSAAFAQRLVIHRAEVNDVAGTITVTGVEFGAAAPEVTFDGVPVALTSNSPTQAVFPLPAGTTPGTYRITVAQPMLGRYFEDS